MKIGFIDADLLDGGTRFPNLALMKLSGYYKGLGAKTKLIDYGQIVEYDKVFLSKVFDYTKIPIDLDSFSNIEYGGTGFYYDKAPELSCEIEHHMPDYDLYADQEGEYYHDYSIGFTTRGCFRKCSFCVNKKYDKVMLHSPINEFLDCNKKYICLLDDNFLGYPDWQNILQQLKDTKKPFQFKQGLDIRLMTESKAEFLSTCKYKGHYIFAFDSIKDRNLIENKLSIWKKYCNKTTKLYVLVAYNSQDISDIINTFERIKILMKYQCLPYIMRYKDYRNSPMYGMYVNLASWCNQPNLFTKKSFREYCIADAERRIGNTCATLKYMEQFEKDYPEIAKKYFDLKYEDYKTPARRVAK